MANDSIGQAAHDGAAHILDAVHHDDEKAYSAAIDEVNKFRDSHSAQDTASYVSAITKELKDSHCLPEVALFEAKNDMDKLGVDSVRKIDLGLLKGQRDTNDLQQVLLNDDIKNFNKLSDDGGYSITKESLTSNLQDWKKTEANQNALVHLFEKNDQGVSLYDRIKTKDGGITADQLSSLNELSKDNPGAANLSAKDCQSIQWLYDSCHWWNHSISKDGLADRCKDNQLDMNELLKHQAKPTDVQTAATEGGAAKKPVDKPADGDKRAQTQHPSNGDNASCPPDQRQRTGGDGGDARANQPANSGGDPRANQPANSGGDARANQPANSGGDARANQPPNSGGDARANQPPNSGGDARANQPADLQPPNVAQDTLTQALTVHQNESYWQVAERLLSLAGQDDPSAKELRSLAHQLWLADNKRPARTLPINHVLTLTPQIKARHDLAPLFQTAPKEEQDNYNAIWI